MSAADTTTQEAATQQRQGEAAGAVSVYMMERKKNAEEYFYDFGGNCHDSDGDSIYEGPAYYDSD